MVTGVKCPRIVLATTLPNTPVEAGIVCGGDLRPHCPTGKATHPCTWRRCSTCKARIDLDGFRGFTHPTDDGSTVFTFG